MLNPWSSDFFTRCFLSMLRVQPHPTELWPCLVWCGLRRQGGHGVLMLEDGPMWAHAYVLRYLGIEPGELWVLHHCDVAACCNPLHLYLGTQQENVRDRWERGSISRSLEKAARPFAPDYVPNFFERKTNPWTRPIEPRAARGVEVSA